MRAVGRIAVAYIKQRYIVLFDYAEELGASEEMLYRALVVANLVTIHLKTGIGRLSAYCGATSAGYICIPRRPASTADAIFAAQLAFAPSQITPEFFPL